jgi:hypothetical protein
MPQASASWLRERVSALSPGPGSDLMRASATDRPTSRRSLLTSARSESHSARGTVTISDASTPTVRSSRSALGSPKSRSQTIGKALHHAASPIMPITCPSGRRAMRQARQARSNACQQAGRRARCVPVRRVNHGDSQSLTESENTPPTCKDTAQSRDTRCLPSWSCGFDSRRPLFVPPLLQGRISLGRTRATGLCGLRPLRSGCRRQTPARRRGSRTIRSLDHALR